MIDLDLVIVADRNCSTSRTYLTYLRAAGYRVRKLLVVDFLFGAPEPMPAKESCTKRLRRMFKTKRRTSIAQPDPPVSDALFRTYCEKLIPHMPIEIDYFAPSDCFDCAASVEPLIAHDYNDTRLQRKILDEAPAVFLYTNGGIVPPRLLHRDGIRFLHVHPGVVPYVRGSDGFYWSVLTRGRPGASCFYMAPGIDTGDVIATMEFSNPGLAAFDRQDAIENEEMLCRALLYALDPHLRAQLFVEVAGMASMGKLDSLPAEKQPLEGRDYYWMHPKLRARVAADMIARGHRDPAARVTPLVR